MTKNVTEMKVESDREIVISRLLNAPPKIVFEAWTQPEFLKRWWGPKSLGVTVKSINADVRVGGEYRYVITVRDQGDVAFSGVYKEVTPHSRLAYSHVYEPAKSEGYVETTVTFEERQGKTFLIQHEVFPSKKVLDIVLQSGMAKGMRETLDQLDELAESLAR